MDAQERRIKRARTALLSEAPTIEPFQYVGDALQPAHVFFTKIVKGVDVQTLSDQIAFHSKGFVTDVQIIERREDTFNYGSATVDSRNAADRLMEASLKGELVIGGERIHVFENTRKTKYSYPVRKFEVSEIIIGWQFESNEFGIASRRRVSKSIFECDFQRRKIFVGWIQNKVRIFIYEIPFYAVSLGAFQSLPRESFKWKHDNEAAFPKLDTKILKIRWRVPPLIYTENLWKPIPEEKEFHHLLNHMANCSAMHRGCYSIEDPDHSFQFQDTMLISLKVKVDSNFSSLLADLSRHDHVTKTPTISSEYWLYDFYSQQSDNDGVRLSRIDMLPVAYWKQESFMTLPYWVRWKIHFLVSTNTVSPTAISKTFLNFVRDNLVINDRNLEHRTWKRTEECSHKKVAQLRMVEALEYLFTSRVQAMTSEENIASEFSLPKVVKIYDSQLVLKLSIALKWWATMQRKNKVLHRKLFIPESTALTGSIAITPTRYVFTGPTTDFTNRLVREFNPHLKLRGKRRNDKDDVDYGQMDNFFARVHFLDENMKSLKGISNALMTYVVERAREVLEKGFSIGGCDLQLIFFSSSQLRSNSAWFLDIRCSTDDPEKIRKWMGNVEHIRCPGKCAARLGLSLSTTHVSSNLKQDEYMVIPDIKTPDGRYTFTDGCGKISPLYAESVASRLQLNTKDGEGISNTVPSAFQIRYRGFKGVLVQFPCEYGKAVVFTESQKKFDANGDHLDICSISAPHAGFLNREIIILLSSLGVQDQVFLDMQDKVLEAMADSESDDKRIINFLKTKGMQTGTQEILSMVDDNLIWEKQLLLLAESGFRINQHQFLRRTVRDLRNQTLVRLRLKTAVHVERAVRLLGVADFSGLLNPDEIVLQVTKKIPGISRSKIIVIEGHVIVTKNPCLHPGDIRVLRAINPPPQLRHLRDVIVFSTIGSRPHADEISGGDLDGDVFFVSWDERLVPKIVVPPMNYEPQQPKTLDREVEFQDLIDFFLDYMLNENLGKVCIAHMVWADKKEEGAKSEECKLLAKLASIAVDMPKTGISASIPRDLLVNEYPDFLERRGLPTYNSQKVLGKMYRKVKDFMEKHDIMCEDEQFDIFPESDILKLKGYETYLESAKATKLLWDSKILGLMNHYGVTSESQIFSGGVWRWHRLYAEDYDMSIKLHYVMYEQIKYFRQLFFEEFNVGTSIQAYFKIPSADRKLDALKKASAWYMATVFLSRDENSDDEYLNRTKAEVENRKLHSFPWVVSDMLIHVKQYVEKVTVLPSTL